MNQTVINFIHKRFPENNGNWLNGNCYWFAHILHSRFPYLKIYYLPVLGHFVAGSEERNEYYDWTGSLEITETPLLWETLCTTDTSWATRLAQDCIM